MSGQDQFGCVALTFDGQGERVALTSSRSGPVWIWRPFADIPEDPVAMPNPGVWPARSLAFSPDGKLLAVGRLATLRGATVDLWDLEQNTVTHAVTARSSVACLAFSPDGQRLAVGTVDRELFIDRVVWGDEEESRARVLIPNAFVPEMLAFSPDGAVLGTIGIAATRGGSFQAFGARQGEVQRNLYGEEDEWEMTCLAYSPDGRLLALCCSDGALEVREADSYDFVRVIEDPEDCVGPIRRAAFSRDSQKVATVDGRNVVCVYDVERAELERKIAAPENLIEALAFSGEQGWITLLTSAGEVQRWSLRDGKLKAKAQFVQPKGGE